MSKIILFGAGGFLHDNENRIKALANTEIVGVSDNNIALIGTRFQEHTIVKLEDIRREYDYIVITSIYAAEIEKDLISKGVNRTKIKRLSEYEAYLNKSNRKYYCATDSEKNEKKRLAAITPILEFNGAFLALIYVLEYLRTEYNYSVVLIAPKYKKEVIEFVIEKGVDFFYFPDVEYSLSKQWADEYEYFIVNTLLMRKCLLFLNPRKTIWWLHESKISYEIEKKLWNDFDKEIYKEFRTYNVSYAERKVFESFFQNTTSEILNYGIPDSLVEIRKQEEFESVDKTVFAVVGFISWIKGQDLLVNAIKLLPKFYRERCDFWLIGESDELSFYDEVKRNANCENIKFWGAMSHNEIEKIYQKIDVLVAPSRQDSLPVSVTEGLMHQKPCIISDVIGMMDYVRDGESVIAFKSENVDALAEKISYVIDNKADMDFIAKNGRRVYERVFSLESVGKKFNDIFLSMDE